MSVPDRIEKSVILAATIGRAWSAVSDAKEFGSWFGAVFDGPFIAGAALSGRIHPTTVDPEVARLQEPHAGTPFEITVDRLEPQRRFSFRWHPYAVAPGVDTTQEATTLVEFALTELADGTRLEITESGFDRLPAERRAEAFAANQGGWDHQAKLIAKYLEARPHRT